MSTPTQVATELFKPLASRYERWAAILSMGQDRRWRERLVAQARVVGTGTVLDVAAGTGSMSRRLADCGFDVIAADQSREMLAAMGGTAVPRVVATAEALPIGGGAVDGVTFGYLLRYVDDLPAAMRELARVTRSGGLVATLEFGRPTGLWRPFWWLYTRTVLPMAGLLIGEGWWEVGRFLGPSIDRFWDAHTPDDLKAVWEEAGITDVQYSKMSLGGGIVMWGTRE